MSKGDGMTFTLLYSSADIQRAAESLMRLRPSYSAILRFYGRLFAALRESQSRVAVSIPDIPASLREIQVREALPLIDKSLFPIDGMEGRRLFQEIGRLADSKDGGPSVSLTGVMRAVSEGSVDPEDLFRAVLEDHSDIFESAAVSSGTDPKLIRFVAYQSIQPSLRVADERLSALYDPNRDWASGVCPVCGSLPALSILEQDGKRIACCSFCWHTWPMARISCPICGTSGNKTHEYLYIEDEKEYRIELCESCKTYLKTIDLRKMSRLLYPPLEQVATLHLDLLAGEKGYASAAPVDI